jgi:hypothetical protein
MIGRNLPMEELTTIEDTFLIAGRGLVPAPTFPLPRTGRFTTLRAPVQVEPPTGPAIEFAGVFAPEHLRLVGGGSRLDGPRRTAAL